MASPDRTATMTNNTTPAPNVASADSEGAGTEAYHAFDKDVVSGTWQVAAGTSGFLKYDFGSSKWACDGYSLTDNGLPTRMPTDWTFAGSNDDAGYTTLDTQTGITFSSSESKQFNVANGQKYRYYKITITNTGGWNPLQIPEMTIQAPNNAGSYAFFL